MISRDSALFQVLRPAVLFGVRINPVLRALDAQPGEAVLDAGCGYGYLVKRLDHSQYTGVDLDADRVAWAKSYFGETNKRRFIARDICHTGLPAKSFDKAVAFGLLHHLPDELATQCILELKRVVRKKIVFLDGVYSRFHLVNNLLCKLDQGQYVRQANQYVALVKPHVQKIDHTTYHAYSGIAKYFMMTCSLDLNP